MFANMSLNNLPHGGSTWSLRHNKMAISDWLIIVYNYLYPFKYKVK